MFHIWTGRFLLSTCLLYTFVVKSGGHPTTLSFPSYYSVINAIGTRSLDRMIERDLHRCSKLSFKNDSGSSTGKILGTNLQALKDFLPMKYSPRFRNPCWYSPMSIPENAFETLANTTLINFPVFSDRKAVEVMYKIKTTKSSRKSFYCLPGVYLAGFPKCATTTLYKLITAHPGLARPRKKEGHFWRTFVQNRMAYLHKQVHALWYLVYMTPAATFIKDHLYALTLDGSASTLWAPIPSLDTNSTQSHSHDESMCLLPSMVSSVLPGAKFVVIMRNPVSRLFSDFWFFCANHNWRNSKGAITVPRKYKEHAPEIFHYYTVQVIDEFTACLERNTSEFECVKRATSGVGSEEACFPLRLGLGMYYFHIVRWLNVFPIDQFLFLKTEDLAGDPFHVVAMVWKFLGLKPVKRRSILHLETRSNEMSWIKSKEYRNKFQMLPETAELLQSFYRPYNNRLARLLKDERFLWQKN